MIYINILFYGIVLKLFFNRTPYLNNKILASQHDHDHNLRDSSLRLPMVHVFKFKHSPVYRIINEWDVLPNILKNKKSKHVFKNC